MDHLGRKLERHTLRTVDARHGTFWPCLAFRLFEKETPKYLARLQSKLLLHFASILFGVPFDSLKDFFARVRTLVVQSDNAACARHSAVQMWMRTHEVKTLGAPGVKDQAVAFVRLNTVLGQCTCRYTLLYLFADVYAFDVYLREPGRDTPIVLVSAPVDVGNPPSRGAQEFFVYLTYTGAAFELWLPRRKHSELPAGLPWLMRGASTRHVRQADAAYQLVRCTPDEVFPVTYFMLAERTVHYAIVAAGDYPTGFYRVLCANKRVLRMTKPLYAFTSRGAERDDPVQCVGYTDDEGSPLAFLLDPAATRLVMLVETADGDFAAQCISEEMKLAVVK